jgi:hypothetical protein
MRNARELNPSSQKNSKPTVEQAACLNHTFKKGGYVKEWMNLLPG